MATCILSCLIALTFVLSSTGPLTAAQPPQQPPVNPAAAEMARVLAPGGRIVMVCPTGCIPSRPTAITGAGRIISATRR